MQQIAILVHGFAIPVQQIGNPVHGNAVPLHRFVILVQQIVVLVQQIGNPEQQIAIPVLPPGVLLLTRTKLLYCNGVSVLRSGNQELLGQE
ncbi:hypothetical protein E5K00_02135 [Hymenobacter aquaticus]|uniref:Uncharacterized protein n=1 Tax=Hymenobacter aquaticus TaxID=1867101 RepID=A0A4Z0Q3J7_9BACT|nr:hypothetical protein [Hymenobacter aquaticus]TGE24036.1 hypothetical protein E5K00_02135 [Hymenobacter aquaticus]